MVMKQGTHMEGCSSEALTVSCLMPISGSPYNYPGEPVSDGHVNEHILRKVLEWSGPLPV